MIMPCQYRIDNEDVGKKTLFACWLLKIIPTITPPPTTKEIYYFLQSSGVSWSSFLNICQFLTGKKAQIYVEKYVENLPSNEFDLSVQDIVMSFALAQSICFPKKIENLIESIEKEAGVSREAWQNETKSKIKLH